MQVKMYNEKIQDEGATMEKLIKQSEIECVRYLSLSSSHSHQPFLRPFW